MPDTLSITEFRKAAGPRFSDAVHGHRPIPIERGSRDRGLLLGNDEVMLLVAGKDFSPEVFMGTGELVSIWLPEFELYGDGTDSRSFTYVDDAIDATIRAMEAGSPRQTYNVGGGEEVSVLEAIEALGEIAGRRLELVRGPRRKGDSRRTSADTTRLRAETGWEPQAPFAPGLAAQWRWAADRVATP